VKINFLKYLVRFAFLQTLITFVTIWYFDNYLIISEQDKYQFYVNLLEDKNRFLPFIPDSIVSVDSALTLIVFLFLILLYSTNFYTYVNELEFTYEKNYFDEFLNIYLLWNSFLFSSFLIFRFTEFSRGNLLFFTLIVPIILLLMRNSEIITSLLGRPIINENFISFNLNDDSLFRNLRIISFRNNIGDYTIGDFELIINKIDEINKTKNINLVIINLEDYKAISKNLEKYLININKKVLLISNNEINFNNNFLYRNENIDGSKFIYFNNDIQYGSKYIFKRIFDLIISILALIILIPLLLSLITYILLTDGGPAVIRQKRVGLHGKPFYMFKIRTMKNNSHELRETLKDLNTKTGPLFKITDDPRIIKGGKFIRKYSLDELPQLFNVVKGDMSLVGPRPLFEADTNQFDKNYMGRLNVLPGMTGLLQINERNTDDFKIWYKYDIEYIENWSLYLDLKILLKTFKAIKNKNAGQ